MKFLRTFNVVTLPEDMSAVRSKAIQLLARREHSRTELIRKLQQRGFDNELIMSVTEQLISNGLLSDVRFAELFVRSRMGAGYGSQRIAEELRQRGISRTEIQFALQSNAQADWKTMLGHAWRKKFAHPPRTSKEQAQQLRYLLYRGFTSEQVSAFMRQLKEHSVTNELDC